MRERRRVFDRRLSRAVSPLGELASRWKLLIAVSVLISALSFLGAALLFSRVGDDARQACERANDVREAINQRTPLHEADKVNLVHLTRALAQNREREARVILRLGRKYGINQDLDEYALILRETGKRSRRILRSASKIKFDKVAPVDCDAVVKSG